MPVSPDDAPYFERQSLMRCGAHALNNLLGGPRFSPAFLDGLALRAAAERPELSPAPFALSLRWPVVGNYDASVLTIALTAGGDVGCESLNVDRRYCLPGEGATERLPADAAARGLIGFLVSEPPKRSLLGRFVGGRHWFSIRAVRGGWVELNSLSAAPRWLEGGGGGGGGGGGCVGGYVGGLVARLKELRSGGDDVKSDIIEVWRGEPPPYDIISRPS